MRKTKVLSQAVELQDLAFKLALDLAKAKPEAIEKEVRRAKAVADAVRSWEYAVDRATTIRGRRWRLKAERDKVTRNLPNRGKRMARPAESPIAAPETVQDEPVSAASVDSAGSSTDAPTVTPATPTVTPTSTVQSAAPAPATPASPAPSDATPADADAPASPS